MIRIDIDMPKNCSQCPLLHHGEYGAFEKSWCDLDGKIVISDKRRPSNCPIKAESEESDDIEATLERLWNDVADEESEVEK